MPKKLLLASLLIGLLVAVVAVAIVRTQQSVASQQLTIAQVSKTNQAHTLPQCSTVGRQQEALVPSADRASLELIAVGHIIDIPAGTNVNVFIASFTPQTASGSLIYAGHYGTYNFTAVRTTNNQGYSSSDGTTDGGWKLTAFDSCKA